MRKEKEILIESMTPRELEIATLIYKGLKQDEIAKKLVIQCSTVHNHARSIRKKTGKKCSKVAVRKLVILGLIDINY